MSDLTRRDFLSAAAAGAFAVRGRAAAAHPTFDGAIELQADLNVVPPRTSSPP